jgi:2-hydroxycyclohexanecarboxyl-CoA dehydrogenase
MALACQAALVTGAGSGIGRAIALRLAAEGVKVGVADLNLGGAIETVSQIAEQDGTSVAIEADVASVKAVREMVDEAEARVGPLDLLVNNAGWDKISRFVESAEADWDRIIAINLKGQIACAHAVLPGMLSRSRGRIVCIASDAGRVGSSGEVVYSAAKGGVIAFVKALAREVGRHGILVNAVAPGPTETPFLKVFEAQPGSEKILEGMARATPLRRLAKPEEIAGVVAFLASEDAGFMTGQTLSVSGGLTMA